MRQFLQRTSRNSFERAKRPFAFVCSLKQLLRDVLSRFMIAATVWQYATSIL
jgi:hypothetical protein